METIHGRTHRRLRLFFAFSCCLLAAHLTAHTGAGQVRVGIETHRGSYLSVLSSKGPQFAAAYLASKIVADVFARGGAPFVVEYQLGPESTASVTLVAKVKKQEKSVTFHLEPTGDQIKQVIFQLPADVFGSKPVVTKLTVKAENIDQTTQPPPNFELYGLGMGEKAVGSMVIVGLNLTPDRVRATRKEKVVYGFRSRSDFDEAYAEFHILGYTSSGEPTKTSVNYQKISGIRRGDLKGGEWNGKNGKGKVSQGRHQLVVKAWYPAKKGGDWTRAWSRQRVFVE